MALKARFLSFLVLFASVCAWTLPATAEPSSVGMLGPAYRDGRTDLSPQTADTTARRRGNLIYHGGPILQKSATYAIFWEPPGFPFPAGYESVIQNYFSDLAGDSGLNTNVNSVGVQYFDKTSAGRIRHHANYDVTDAGSQVVTDSYPPSGCAVRRRLGYTHCLTDGQIRRKVEGVRRHTHLHAIFFMFLPPDVDTCFGGTVCASNIFCAYHSAFRSGSSWVLYTNQPFADIPGCDTLESPNDNPADKTLNVVSHEHNETITDPLGNAWFTRSGLENGDKCSFTFGATLGGTPDHDAFNQVIGAHTYYLQEEWSNRSRKCLQRGQ
jgi:hypothetical protein